MLVYQRVYTNIYQAYIPYIYHISWDDRVMLKMSMLVYQRVSKSHNIITVGVWIQPFHWAGPDLATGLRDQGDQVQRRSTHGAKESLIGIHGEWRKRIVEGLPDDIWWVWVNTYDTIFSGLFTSINTSYFDVNRRGTRVLTHPHDFLWNNWCVMMVSSILTNTWRLDWGYHQNGDLHGKSVIFCFKAKSSRCPKLRQCSFWIFVGKELQIDYWEWSVDP